MSQRLGFNVFLVLESPREVELVLREADALGVRPQWASASNLPMK